ncbi:MAG: acetate--CoA ligase family protein [Deltaproteobacteria bacterium]|mgnify:FL=1|nr:acetate--CoA ligase family protein [Deltaproteobacteria bacterium]
MEKLFYPESIAIIGLSSKSSNIPRLVLENLIRWGYKGRIFGVNPRATDAHVDGIKMYRDVRDLPIVPDLVFVMIPARLVPDAVEACGAAGVKRMAIPTGGFNELGEEGKKLSDQVVATARKYGIRFVGPNGVTVANTANGLCLPFVPSFSPPKGGLSIISQSGGVGLMLWNLMTDDNVGMAKFASIGNKLDLDEVDFLEYFGRDPETKVIGLYLESIPRGERLIAAAAKIDKPVIVLKSNTTVAGRKAAMSHTAALANDEDIIDAAFERAGIIRIRHFNDFIAMAKAFELPPMRGKRMMIMSPAGGFTVMMADLCEEKGFVFADPGPAFYDELKNSSNAGVINFSNPLDMGDIYDTQVYSSIFYSVMHNPGVDGAVFVTQWPEMPRGEDVFYRMFHTDLSKEVAGTILSSGKPLGVCLFGLSATISRIKQNLDFPIFNNANEMIRAFKRQCDFYAKKAAPPAVYTLPAGVDLPAARNWIAKNSGVRGEETLDLLDFFGISGALSDVARDAQAAVAAAEKLGYPVVLKIVSPDAIHKSEAGGVRTGVHNAAGVRDAFAALRDNLYRYKARARFDGVRVARQAKDGCDMFIGGKYDPSFGPVVFFGYGGIYVEVFADTASVLCPAGAGEIEEKLRLLKSCRILQGVRGGKAGDIAGYVAMIERVTHLMSAFPQIRELDINPVRVPADGSGVVALDARIRIEDVS